MKNYLFLLLLFSAVFIQPIKAQNSLDSYFSKTDAFLKDVVRDGLIDYKKIKQSPEELNTILNIANKQNIPVTDKDNYRAFWINAYNLLVIKSVVENYPIKSPLDVKGFFDTNKHAVGGKEITLNDIENKLLREQFNFDARFHFVLVCAGKGCPPIIKEAYMPATIDSQLTNQTKMALNDSDFIKVNEKKKKIGFSQIFEWYNSDFTSGNKTIVNYINQYSKNQYSNKFKSYYYPYNWELNQTK